MGSTASCFLSTLLAVAMIAAGCGSDDSDAETEPASTTRTAESSAASESALVGEWVADNECQALADALAEAGLEEFTVEMAKGAGLLPPGQPDPADLCTGSKPLQHSHSFSASGTFHSYDENGDEVDFGSYESTGEDAFTLSRPPFESDVRYLVDGDTATFDVVVPECDSQRCRLGAALAIATFFPRTYDRVR